jgi:hypothetical protein
MDRFGIMETDLIIYPLFFSFTSKTASGQVVISNDSDSDLIQYQHQNYHKVDADKFAAFKVIS